MMGVLPLCREAVDVFLAPVDWARYTMEDIKNCKFEFLKQQEKQRQEDSKRLHESFERQEEKFGKLLECLTKENDPGNLNIFSLESAINLVGEFIWKPEEVTFKAYFRRYESIFEKDCEKWPDEKKVRLLLVKFGAAEQEKYVDFILPRQPSEVTFRVTIQILKKWWGGGQNSLINTRWQCLNLTKKDCEDYTTFASTVNRYCEKFQLNEITPDMFKCLSFLQALASPSEKEVRTRLLTDLKWNAVSSRQWLCRYCCMDAPPGR